MTRGNCPQCGKPFAVYATRTDADSRMRYCKCHKCGTRPAQQPELVPLSQAPRQSGPGQSNSLYPR